MGCVLPNEVEVINLLLICELVIALMLLHYLESKADHFCGNNEV